MPHREETRIHSFEQAGAYPDLPVFRLSKRGVGRLRRDPETGIGRAQSWWDDDDRLTRPFRSIGATRLLQLACGTFHSPDRLGREQQRFANVVSVQVDVGPEDRGHSDL